MPKPAVDLVAAREHVAAEAESIAAVAQTLDGRFSAVVRLIDDASGKVLTTAVGNSGTIAMRLAHILALCGAEAMYLDANQALHGSVGAVRADDVLLAFSKGGVTDEVNDFVRLAQRRGAVVIAVTECADSPLAKLADHVQLLPRSHADHAGLIGMGSALAQAAWGDALAVSLLSVRGVSPTEIVARHPRGMVGKLDRSEAGS